MPPRSILALACVTFLMSVAAAGLAPAASQEGATQEPTEPPKEPEAGKAEEEPGKGAIKDRLTLSIGGASFEIHARGRGMTEFFHQPVGLATRRVILQQTQDLRFDPATGAAFMAEASFEIVPRISATADVITSTPGDSLFIDNRLVGKFRQPGDFTLAEFQATAAPEYLEWSIGGMYRFFPGKKKGQGSRGYVDGVIAYRKAAADYEFDAGRLVRNPFDPNSLEPNNFDRSGATPASYALDFETLTGGVRIGGHLGERLVLESTIAPIWFARFEGNADLGPHGLIYVHQPFEHQSGAFDVPGCNSTDGNPLTPPCGLVNADLRTTSMRVRQKSSRGRGLGLDARADLKITEWFGIVVGYHRQDFRSLGGSETRIMGVRPNQVVQNGELVKAEVTTQEVFLRGRFRLF